MRASNYFYHYGTVPRHPGENIRTRAAAGGGYFDRRRHSPPCRRPGMTPGSTNYFGIAIASMLRPICGLR